MDDAFAKKREFSVEYSIDKDGTSMRMMSKGNPNFNHEGTFAGYIGSCVQLPE